MKHTQKSLPPGNCLHPVKISQGHLVHDFHNDKERSYEFISYIDELFDNNNFVVTFLPQFLPYCLLILFCFGKLKLLHHIVIILWVVNLN